MNGMYFGVIKSMRGAVFWDSIPEPQDTIVCRPKQKRKIKWKLTEKNLNYKNFPRKKHTENALQTC